MLMFVITGDILMSTSYHLLTTYLLARRHNRKNIPTAQQSQVSTTGNN